MGRIPGYAVHSISSRLAGEGQEVFRPAVRAADAGESEFRVAAVEIAINHLLDDRPEKTVLPLETVFIFALAGQNFHS
jgi:hypothetical protein